MDWLKNLMKPLILKRYYNLRNKILIINMLKFIYTY